MARYVALPIERDPVEAEEQSFEVIRQQWPDWSPETADGMTQLLRGAAVMYADLAELATRMGEEGFRFFGRGLVNLPPIEDRPATATVRFTAQDLNGPYVVPEDLEVGGRDASGALRGFRTVGSAVIANGAETVDVEVEATELGTVANGITGAAEFLEYIDYLSTVAFVGVSGGGVDREGDTPYLDRLATELQLMSPVPITTPDYAVIARRLAGPGYRATAIKGLNPADGSGANRRFVAVALKDAAGNAAPPLVKAYVEATLTAMREGNSVVPLFDPVQTPVDVAFTGTALPGWDPVAVNAAAVARLQAYLYPGTWGQRSDTGEDLEWRNVPLVRWGEVNEQLQRVEGLEFVDTLQLGLNGGPLQGTGVNLSLPGYAPLPLAGTIAGTITAG